MGKGKKSKKDEQPVDSDGSDMSDEAPAPAPAPTKSKSKKKTKDIVDDLEDLDLSDDDAKPSKSKSKSKKKKGKKKGGDSDSDGEVEAKPSAFAMLMDDSLPSSDGDNSEVEEKPVVVVEKKNNKKDKKGKGGGGADEDFEDQPRDEAPQPPPKEEKGKKKKKKKKDMEDDEDLDAMLAALRAEYNEEAPPPEAANAFAADDDKKEKKKKKKGKKDTEEAEEAGFEVVDGEEVGGTVKTAAQKKKEKKEKQKQKEKEKPQQENAASEEKVTEEKPAAEGEGDDKEGTPEGGEETDKKGKKKKGKEEKEKKGKKPNKAVIAAMQEALQKQKDEEERLRLKEEEEERAREERERQLEEEKAELERKKAEKKERDRLRKEELKAQGKLLTPAQKAARARAEAALEAMRAQGIIVPDLPAVTGGDGNKDGKKKFVVYGKKNKKQQGQQRPSEYKKEETKVEEKKEDSAAKVEQEEEIKDAWDAESEEEKEEEVKKETPVAEVKEKEASAESTTKKEESAEEESDDGEDEEGSDEDSDEDSEEESDDEEEEESEEDLDEAERKRNKAMERITKRKEQHEKNRSEDVLRAPVVCVLGHVDTGKTKILDKLRRTNVQDGEAGGITQQIGATNVPIAVIQEQCKMVQEFTSSKLMLPGLLIIDTPGHESFSNLRDRGSSLCDIAILVVDIMHGLEPQTIESLNLLKKKKTPFIVALNKIDRLYEWKPNRHKDVRDVIESQQHNTQLEFKKRKDEVILGLAEQGLNSSLFWENPDPTDYINLMPTSAHSGDGMGNLMAMLVSISQQYLRKRLSYTEELQATVLEVKAIGGFGTTIDVILVNGRLKFGQTLILPGTDGAIVTSVKALLTPSKMQDLRVKNQYIEHKELMAAQGVKIAAKELEKAIAGLSLRVANHPDEVELCKELAEHDLKSALNAIKTKPLGVFVQASTLGSLEALLEFLKVSKIPYAGVRIGPVVKKDVMRASTMLEHDEKFAVILAFDVKVERDAQEMADREGVRIFQADIIYHLFDRFTEYQAELVRQKKEQFRSIAVFPCKLRVMKEHVYMSRDPIVCGVKVEAGVVKTGTPICVPSKEFCYIGICTGIQHNSKDVDSARKGDEVCVKIEAVPGEAPKMFGRHFDETDLLVSKISRQSIDACKDYFRDELSKGEWVLMVELKKTFQIL